MTRGFVMTRIFQVGDIVVFSRAFLQSAGWYTGVPIDGRVEGFETVGSTVYLRVRWCDQEEDKRVLPANVILASEKHLEPR